MSRLIEADSLEERLPERAAAIVRLAPTVDAVKVIRCKECEEYVPFMPDGTHLCIRLGTFYGKTKPNDYCSYGKRKDFFNEFNKPHTPEEEHRVVAAAELFGNEVK